MNVQDILSKLVSFPVLGGQSNIPIAEWIEDYLTKHNVDFVNVPNEEGNKRSIHCRIGPPVDGGFILSGHMDVVPVEGQDWDTNPFMLTDKEDGNLYGRGSCDMKAYIACCLSMLPEMKKASLQKPIYFAFSYDEEIGCLAAPALGAHIKTYYEEQPSYAIIGEPSMMQPVVGQKGIVIYETSVNGSAGHSSRIRTEVSAIHEMAKLIVWLENKMNSLVDSGQLDDRFEPAHTSIHCGLIPQAGIAPNVISDSAKFFWDVRVIPKDKARDIFEEFDAYCRSVEAKCQKRYKDFKIETILSHPDVPALDTPEDLAIVEIIKSIPNRSDLGAVFYAAEAGQFSEAGFQYLLCGPGDIAQAHRANEFVAKEQLEKCCDMLGRLIKYLS